MPLLDYTDPLPGDPRSAAAVNTILTAFSNATKAVDRANLREEGLDLRNFSSNTALEANTLWRGAWAGAVHLTNAAMAIPSLGGVPAELDLTAHPITVATSERLIIEARLVANTAAAGPVYGVQDQNMVETEIATDRGFGYVREVGSGASRGWVNGPIFNTGIGAEGVLSMFCVIGDLFGPYTINKIALRARGVDTGAGSVSYRLEYGLLYAYRVKLTI